MSSSTPQLSPPSSDPSAVFSIRIVSIDYDMAAPIPGLDFCESPCFQGRRVEEVPVIRIYGSTLAGQKACLHVHRALPYLYISCSELPASKGGQTCGLDICYALEKVLQFKGMSGLKRQHVHGYSLVGAKKFYGYHSAEELFVKIYLYHPTDVARAAALLLGGSILNRSIQPYESHVPFLLQFMVDYNLYGMGHLHASKVKFRHPLPDKFIPRAVRYTGQTNSVFEKLTSISPSLQSDSSPEVIGNPAFWLSSTVPSEWTWATLDNNEDASDGKHTYCIKRQSICELEGDSCVDDILNQRAKIYSSLSQTSTDTKMVQSLVPIWEEEYERSGLQGSTGFLDINKPVPEIVLRSLCDGLEYGNALSDIHKDAQKMSLSKGSLEGDEKFEQHFKSAQAGSFVKPSEDQKPSHSGAESSSQKIISSTMIGSKEGKVADIEALGLLSWLASSQAAEDFSLDDELTHEAILSPLLPSKNYEEALERAHLDYEVASQKECQDILDSQEGFRFGDLEVKAASSGDHDCSVSDQLVNVIPQVDGSSDDQISLPQISEVPVRGKMERASSDIAGKHLAVTSGRKDTRNHLLWGPLPFSIKQKELHVSSLSTADCDESPDEVANIVDANSSIGSLTGETCEASEMEAEQKPRMMGEERQLTSSVRDLMRRKRYYHVEQFEHGGHLFEEMAIENQCDAVLHREKPDGQSHYSNEDSLMPSEIPHIKSHFPKRHGTETCQESMRCTATYTDGPSEVVLPAEWQNPAKRRLSFVPSVDLCFQVDAPKEDLDLHQAPSKRECLHASVRSLEIADRSILQSDGTSDKIHESTHSRQLPPIVLPEFSEETCKQDSSIHSLQLKSGLTACTFIEEGVKRPHAIEFREVGASFIEGLSFHGNLDLNSRECSNASKNSSEPHSSNFTKINPAFGLSALQTSDSAHRRFDTRTCNSCIDLHTGFVEMTFNKKPPILEKTSGLLEDSRFPVAGVIRDMDNSSLSDSERQSPDFPPFFVNDEMDKGNHKSFVAGSCSEAVRGVPVHFQNDGSFSYLLTFAASPPSPLSVYQWFLAQAEQNISHESTELSSKISDHSVNKTENGNCCCHDVKKKSTSPKGLEASPAKLVSQGSIRNPCSGCPQSIPCDPKKMIDNANSSSGNILHSEVVSRGKSKGACIGMQDRSSMSGCFDVSQISGPNEKSKTTPLSQIGFRDPASAGGGQNLTLFSMEILAESRGNLLPDPQFDAVNLIVLAVQEDTDNNAKLFVLLRDHNMKSCGRNVDGISGCTVVTFPEERCLFDHLVRLIGLFDPDILLGWEIQGSSLGFLAERAAHLGIHLLKNISRTPSIESKHEVKTSAFPDQEVTTKLASETVIDSIVLEDAIIEDEWGRNHASGIHVGGRIVLNVWRLMRSELKLSMYTVEAVAEEVLRRKIPCISARTLNKWFSSGGQIARLRCIEYVLERANLNLQIMNQLDMINRTSELARVFGIDFFSVLSRGSQFRVESMLLRLAHTQNYLAISPGNQQVASQPAMECLPLVMEPESGFYADPVVVLDFQSLYPSMIIAYNLCYSTCLGNVLPSRGNVLGVSSFSPDPRLAIDCKEQMLLSPNGILYVPSKVRRGVLPRLLEEILSTRIMVKKAMKKLLPSQQVLQRVLNARQLALKLIANVTYGYTAAGFSGRMPCAELADSIVQCGRKTLEKAISFTNSHNTWNARVIYGDTDSMFVLLRGRSVEEAFEIGNEIALTITSMNPNPVTLKMEKVYYPCFLLTKKRYVGCSYESPNQEKPLFDAKGIETVRRDSCPAVTKTFEKSLRLFFEHRDITKVKLYLQRQWTRILSGKVSLQDFVFAKEVRLGTYSSRASSLPPAAIVAIKAMKVDPRSEPRYGERIPYVVIHGEPGARLVDMVVNPLELLEINSPYRLNDAYYINKQIIPALQRAFGLLGVDLSKWFSEIPRPVRSTVAKRHSCESSSVSSLYGFDGKQETCKKGHTRNRIDKYYLSKHCAVCGNVVQASAYLCDSCCNKGPLVATVVVGKTSRLERDIHHLSAICRHCGGGDWIVESGVKCTSLACAVFYERRKVQKELQSLSAVAAEAGLYPRCVSEWF